MSRCSTHYCDRPPTFFSSNTSLSCTTWIIRLDFTIRVHAKKRMNTTVEIDQNNRNQQYSIGDRKMPVIRTTRTGWMWLLLLPRDSDVAMVLFFSRTPHRIHDARCYNYTRRTVWSSSESNKCRRTIFIRLSARHHALCPKASEKY